MRPSFPYSTFSRITRSKGISVEPLNANAFGLSRPHNARVPDTATACFSPGTLVATRRGAVRVERLRAGDLVITNVDRVRPILRISRQRIDLTQHRFPQAVSPIRIAPHALADGLPQRPLYLSPDHAIFIDDMLIGLKSLVNGTTITQTDAGQCTYYHLDLIREECSRADEHPVETHLTTDYRQVVVLHPDLRDMEAQIGLRWPSPVYDHEQIAVVVGRLRRQAKILSGAADRPKEGSIRMLWRLFRP